MKNLSVQIFVPTGIIGVGMSMDSSLAFIALIFCVTAAFSLFLAVRGRAAGRKTGFDKRIVRWGTAAALLMAALLFFLNRVNVILLGVNPTLFVTLPVMVSAVAAVLCAAFPAKPVFVLTFLIGAAGLGSELLLISMVLGGFWGGRHGLVLWVISSIFYASSLVLSGMGFGAAGMELEADPAPEADSAPERQQEAGALIILSEPFVGQELPLPAHESLKIGSDPADCQLILNLPGEPRCLGIVCRLDKRAAYLITCPMGSELSYEDGTPVPVNEPVMAEPGTVFLDGQTGQAVFQLGA